MMSAHFAKVPHPNDTTTAVPQYESARKLAKFVRDGKDTHCWWNSLVWDMTTPIQGAGLEFQRTTAEQTRNLEDQNMLAPLSAATSTRAEVLFTPHGKKQLKPDDMLKEEILIEYSQLFKFHNADDVLNAEGGPKLSEMSQKVQDVIFDEAHNGEAFKNALSLVSKLQNKQIETNEEMVEYLEKALGMTGTPDAFYGPIVLGDHESHNKGESTTCLLLRDEAAAIALRAETNLFVTSKVIKGATFWLVPMDPRQRHVVTDALLEEKGAKDFMTGKHGEFGRYGGYTGGAAAIFGPGGLLAEGVTLKYGAPMKAWDAKGSAAGKASGLLVKLHYPQPELPGGAVNGQFEEKLIWTVSTVDEGNKEVIKLGVRSRAGAESINGSGDQEGIWNMSMTQEGNIFAIPFNPVVCPFCYKQSEAEQMGLTTEKWIQLKNAEFSDAHFRLATTTDLLAKQLTSARQPDGGVGNWDFLVWTTEEWSLLQAA